MENYVIRRITTNDYHDIHELNLKLGYAYDEEKVAERIQNILDAGIDLILVAELEGKVVGYVHGTPYGTLYSDNLVSIIQMVVTNETRAVSYTHLINALCIRSIAKNHAAGIYIG